MRSTPPTASESGTLRISAEPDPRTHPVPLAVRLDGVPIEGATVTHAALAGDHELAFEMGAVSESRGVFMRPPRSSIVGR